MCVLMKKQNIQLPILRTYFVIKHGNQMRGKYFKPENTFEKGIFA